MSVQFGSFPAETLAFLSGIAANNEKAWFEENRGRYETGYVSPARAFAEAVGPKLAEISPTVRWEAKINGSIMRINRDVRFSKDKRPYKDHLDLWFWHGERKGWDCPGFYLRITSQRLFIGAGMHVLKDATLDRFRVAALDDRAGSELEAAIGQVTATGPYEVGGATRKSAPRGMDAAVPRGHFLLHEGLFAGLELPAGDALESGFGDRALSHFAACWPIARWLLAEVCD